MAATGSRLAGSFKTVATIHANDSASLREPRRTTSSSSPRGASPEVAPGPSSTATAATTRTTSPTLRKTAPGVYRGTESPYPYSCLTAPNATFTAKHVVKVTKTKNGKATAFKGSSKVTIANCSIATFIHYTLKGTLN
jgi:hypothetical protein